MTDTLLAPVEAILANLKARRAVYQRQFDLAMKRNNPQRAIEFEARIEEVRRILAFVDPHNFGNGEFYRPEEPDGIGTHKTIDGVRIIPWVRAYRENNHCTLPEAKAAWDEHPKD